MRCPEYCFVKSKTTRAIASLPTSYLVELIATASKKSLSVSILRIKVKRRRKIARVCTDVLTIRFLPGNRRERFFVVVNAFSPLCNILDIVTYRPKRTLVLLHRNVS